MDSKKIESLEKFLTIAIAAFELVDAMHKMIGGKPHAKTAEMVDLYRLSLQEIKQEKPDMVKIDFLLKQMEILASQPLPKFPSGAVPNTKANQDET